MLDDGRLTDGQGRTVDFRNTLVIMTSNIGSVHIQDILEDRAKSTDAYWGKDNHKELRDKVMDDLRASFKPEFLNRIDEIIIFNALNPVLLKQIVDIQVERMKKYLHEKKIDIVLTDEAKAHVAKAGYDPVYGARPLKRAIQNEILNPLAMKLLERAFSEGDVVEVDYVDNKMVFNKTYVAEFAS
jgi:ATP-dependent Clp protease ATP-binding subunit ClpB